MRTTLLTRLSFSFRGLLLAPAVLGLLGGGISARAAEPLAFSVTISGNANVPTVEIKNDSQTQIKSLTMTVGNPLKNFDYITSLVAPRGGTISGDLVAPISGRSFAVSVSLQGWDPGETISFAVDIDDGPYGAGTDTVEDYRTVLFNNGFSVPNAQISVTSTEDQVAVLTLEDTLPSNLSSYTFRLATPRRLQVTSVAEAGGEDYVSKAKVQIFRDDQLVYTSPEIGRTFPVPNVFNGDTIEITAPQEVYKSLFGEDITDSVGNDPQKILDDAEERFTAIGISVNDVAQTGDPTLYRFDIKSDTVVVIKWRHDYALTVEHDFTLTQSQETDASGNPWAGPLDSGAEGNPDPPAKKSWIKRGETVVGQIDGQVIDFTHPGLDIRYVPKAFRAYGPPNPLTSAATDSKDRLTSTNEVDIRVPLQGLIGAYAGVTDAEPITITSPGHGLTNGTRIVIFNSGVDEYNGKTFEVTWLSADTFSIPAKFKGNPAVKGEWRTPSAIEFPFSVGQAPPQRQQVSQFTMYGPGGIKYVWQIQFGVKVNVDDPSRAALPKVYQNKNGTNFLVGSLEGTFWFDPGVALQVATAANEAGTNSQALTGWVNGDGYYFSSSGEIDSSDGSLIQGGPTQRSDGSPVAAWLEGFFDANGKTQRGLEIPSLRRPVRVLWRYGNQQLRVNAAIGEYVFQNDPARASLFTVQPEQILQVSVTGSNPNVAASDMAVWDPVAQRLYPLVPGIFKAIWRPGPEATESVEVIVTVNYPTPAHYPHIADTPPVALDPDPIDTFIFKELKYAENDAAVDGNNQFTASQPGHAVLLFSEIQPVGRGQPREFLRVRVVETKRWNDNLAASGTAIIGQKITDPLDRANLGTGYVKFENARYNPFVYDAAKLEGIASKDIYDLTALRSGSREKIVVAKDKLPGPVIAVNLHPGAASSNRVVVVWYDDPTENDELLWPHRARVYYPRWPVNAAEGLGRIVIASQFGSESVDAFGQDQEVAPAIGNDPRETTYNPARLQQVQIYNQPDETQPGYNPNEEHALIAPSLRFAEVSPRPPAVYALRFNDLNHYALTSPTEVGQPANYSSHPYVLSQFFDGADQEFKMRVYRVVREDANFDNYSFANPAKLVASTPPRTLLAEPHLTMKAGEPVIPFYPLGVVIGASPCPQTFGENLKPQATYWEDHKGSSWAVSGGENAWFTVSYFYPLAPDFWWPENEPGYLRDVVENQVVVHKATVPQTGDCVSFLPEDIQALLAKAPESNLTLSQSLTNHVNPTRVLFKSDWPDNPPLLKSGETLTFSGGEYHSDHPLRAIVNGDGEVQQVETPGLPGIVAFATAEVVFDSLNPLAETGKWRQSKNWTARVAQGLDTRSVPLPFADFPADLQPATKRTRLKGGKFVFNDLPASLQKRVRYDSLTGKLEFFGLLNDKEIGDPTLTAAPPAVYVLEPNVMTANEEEQLSGLSADQNWKDAVAHLAKLSRNPNLIDSNNPNLPNPSDSNYRSRLETFWTDYYRTIGALPPGGVLPLPVEIADADTGYLVGLEPRILRDGTGETVTVEDPAVPGLQRVVSDPKQAAPVRAFGPGLALLPNPAFLDPKANLPDISWVTVVENNDPSLGGSPIILHVIQVDRRERYRGAIKTVASDNVFDENLVLRHTGDFGANADELVFEWWYRPDDGSLDVPPPDLVPAGQTNPWKLFPDPTGKRGQGRYQILLKGNPNAPEALLADTWWFVRYRHQNDNVQGTDWNVPQTDATGTVVDDRVNFTWAGAGNSDPFHDFDQNGIPDYRAQLAQGWIKRVLDAVNPYEARIRDFEGDSPSTISSMISEFGQRFEGPVALNPDKNVIENVGLIELYETILKRGRDLSIDLSRPVSTPAIANALQLASTRISDFYTLLGNEAYSDAIDPTIGFGSDSVEYGSLAPTVFAFQNQMASLMDEELALLHGVDDYFARPVYNRLFWNFTKGEGEAAYALNYNISDINQDGFIDENDAMILYPQGHGDAWGHYLTALRNQYDLLRHPYFNWVSRSEFYNLQDIVIPVDFLDERKFAQTAAAKAKVGAEIVNLTYRQKYVEDPTAQWQGYTDSNKDRSWGVQGWARRAAQGAYFDWVTANALLPSQHPNTNLVGIQKVDRTTNPDIAVISANLNAIQQTFDQANNGQNPLGLSGNVVPFDINPDQIDDQVFGKTHFEQIYDRADMARENAVAAWDNANQSRNMLRQVANSEADFRNSVFQEDLTYKNRLIQIFGKPYEGTIGPGRLYPAGYDGPDTLLFMYVDIRQIDDTTVPGPALSFASFNTNGVLNGGDIYQAFQNGQGSGGAPRAKLADFQNPFQPLYLSDDVRRLFAPTFVPDSSGNTSVSARSGLYAVNYTDLQNPKVPLENLTQFMPVTAAGYTFQAPRDWGTRLSSGELQLLINEMIQQEVQVAVAIGDWDGLQGDIVRTLRLINAKLDKAANVRLKNEVFSRVKTITMNVIKGIEGTLEVLGATKATVTRTLELTGDALPSNLPTGGLAVSPGDALAPADAGFKLASVAVSGGISAGEAALKLVKLASEIAIDVAENELTLFEQREEDALAAKEMLVDLENKVGDEPIKRIAIFKEMQALRALSEKYRALVGEGTRLIDERAAYNKRVAAQTQQKRYQDMTFRVSRNHALQIYRSAFDVAARYAYLAGKAYDYEINLDPSDSGSPVSIFSDIVRSRDLGSLGAALAWLKANYDSLKGQYGINNPQLETGKLSLRTELFRILPKGGTQPGGTNQSGQFPSPGRDSDQLWRQTLLDAKVDDLWNVPEFRYYCRPFVSEADTEGYHLAQPGLVIRFSSKIAAGENFFGRPLGGADHAYDPSHFTTKVRSVGVWFSDYRSDDVLNDLPETPRVYLIPVGMDVMSLPSSDNPSVVRLWKVTDQRIPVPLPARTADLDAANWIPILDSLNGRLGEPRKFAGFRAYHDGGDAVNTDELVFDSRLIGRSIWNTQWMLIIPGLTLNADPAVGLDRFIQQVSDIKLVFQTYGYSGD
jgi:hypothetical protein